MTSNQIITIEKQIVPIVKKAELIEIKDTPTMTEATELLSQMNKVNDRITQEKEKVTKPLNEALKAERARWKPIESIYENGITLLRRKMSQYQTDQMRRIREEEAKIAARIGSGKGKLTIETAAKKMSEIDTVPDAITTQVGSIKFRTDKKLVIDSINELPREYMIPNEKLITQALREGKKIAGAHLEEIQVPVNTR